MLQGWWDFQLVLLECPGFDFFICWSQKLNPRLYDIWRVSSWCHSGGKIESNWALVWSWCKFEAGNVLRRQGCGSAPVGKDFSHLPCESPLEDFYFRVSWRSHDYHFVIFILVYDIWSLAVIHAQVIWLQSSTCS